jgi:UDP-N-acetylmuramoyl-L-alanyl-D-glutamate--2,6-diaminopimelate ligase
MAEKIWFAWRHCAWVEKLRLLIPDWLVNYFWHLPKAVLANLYFGFPSRRLTVIGVTGTDGKTTTASLIYEILKKAGKKVALISTVSAKMGNQEISTGLHVTSPDAFVLQKLLRKISDQRFEYLVLEVTSHGLTQFRLWGIKFKIGVVTNVTHEHLDYHRTFKNYLAAKGKLLRKVDFAVLNRDDASFGYLNQVRRPSSQLVSYGLKAAADLTPGKFKFKTSLPGDYNQANCLAAIGAARSLKVRDQLIRQALANFPGVPGRLEKINLGQDFSVWVDFAHTPNALEKVLNHLQGQRGKGRLIAVFGCAGLRDRKKRPLMGEVAAGLADLVVLTAEDPRTEDVNQIIDQIAQGCLKAGAKEKRVSQSNESVHQTEKALFFRIPARQEAINFAINQARKGDLVVVCGKGHEKSMCFGNLEKPWTDQEAVKKALKSLKR